MVQFVKRSRKGSSNFVVCNVNERRRLKRTQTRTACNSIYSLNKSAVEQKLNRRVNYDVVVHFCTYRQTSLVLWLTEWIFLVFRRRFCSSCHCFAQFPLLSSGLRNRPHNRQLPDNISRITDCTFTVRMLYRNFMYRLLCILDLRSVLFLCTVQLRFDSSQ